MTEQKKLAAKTRKQPEETSSSAGDEASGNVMQQARGWAGVARKAREDCRKGAEAEKEVQRRRNESGQ